jgi:hypothetical protein
MSKGLDPYDPVLMAEVQRHATSFSDLPVRLWNPPIILPLLSLLSFFSFQEARLLWFIASVCTYSAVVLLLLKTQTGIFSDFVMREKGYFRQLLLVITISFYPAVLALSYGQFSLFLLAGFGLFLFLASSGESKWRYLLAGACLSITVCKPHLLALCYCLLVLRSFNSVRDRWLVLGLVLGTLFLGGLVSFQQPRIWQLYERALTAPPYFWFTPTAGTYLQLYGGKNTAYLRYIPFLLGVGATVVVAVRSTLETLKLIILFVPLSLFCSPYGWVYDHSLMLPAILSALAVPKSDFLGALAKCVLYLCVISYYVLYGELSQHYFVFVPPLVFFAVAVLFREKPDKGYPVGSRASL